MSMADDLPTNLRPRDVPAGTQMIWKMAGGIIREIHLNFPDGSSRQVPVAAPNFGG